MKARLQSRFPIPLASLLLGSSAVAQAPLEDELDYVRGVVKELRFVDLAQHEVERLKKRYTDKRDRKRVAQLAVEVSLEGAKLHPDRETRRALFKDALEESQDLIERYRGETVAHEARETLVRACIEFGSFLNEEIELAREAETPTSRVAELEAAASRVFRTGVDATRIVQRQHEAVDGEEIGAFLAWMHRGMLLREHARAVVKDRTYLADQAATTLEDLIFEVGEETALGQRALFERAMVEEVVGDHEAAIRSYTDTIDAIWLALAGEFSGDLPEEVQRMMFDMMQEVYARLGIICVKEAEFARLDALVAQLRERVAEFRTEPHHFFGDSLFLSQARGWALSGRSDRVSAALRRARAINGRHARDFLGRRAKNLIRDILRSSAELVTGDLLFEVAKGRYQEQEFDAAVVGCKRALARMDAAARKQFGFEAWRMIARSNVKMRRYLEATLAYIRALEGHGDQLMQRDERAAERTARRAAFCFAKAAKLAGAPRAFQPLEARVETLLRRFSPGFATANDYNRGLEAKSAGDHARAAEHFLSVDPDYEKYELALAHAILCLYRQDDYDEACAHIMKLREHAAEHAIEEGRRAEHVYRNQALAWAHYVDGRIRYARAIGEDGKPDVKQFGDIVRHFSEFEAVHAKHARNLMPIVHEILGRLHMEIGNDTKALHRYAALKRLGESIPNAHRTLGLALFGEFDDRIENLESALRAAEKVGNRSDEDEIEANLIEVRKEALAFGFDFASSVHPPTYPVLYNLMRIAEDLEDWKRCEWAAERILSDHGDSKRSSLDQVRPVLGQALLRQSGRLREALDVLELAEKQWDDDPSKKKTTAYYEVLRFKALALGGWPAFSEDRIHYEPNPGLGKPHEAYEILWGKEYRSFALNSQRTPRFSLDWYRYHLELYFFCKRAERIDSKFAQRARTIYNIARSTDDFATLKRLGRRGRDMAMLFQWIGY